MRHDEVMTGARLWWLYMLACKGGRLYAGIALDVSARFALHQRGKGAKFTRANPPLQVLAMQPFETRAAASRAEYALKRLSRNGKLEWASRWRCHHFKSSGTTKSL